MRKLSFVNDKNMYIYCQNNAWYDKGIIIEWINKIFLKTVYKKKYYL